MSSNNALLSTQGVQKCFGDLQALSDVSPEIREDEICSLVGPSGTGKTMFLGVIAGLYTPDAGEFMLGDTPCQPTAVHEVVKAGIARTFQNIRLFGDMAATENVMVGRHVCAKAGLIGAVFRTKVACEEKQSIEDWAYDLLDYVGIGKYANYMVHNLLYGHQCRLEVARTLATRLKLLILSELVTSVNATEKVELRGLLGKIRSDGKTILLIGYDVKLMMDLCNHLTMLDYGKVIAQGLPHEVQSNSAMIEAYFGVSAH